MADRSLHRCVLFDLDGTVANTIPLIIASYQHALRTVLAVSATADEARGWIGQTLVRTFGDRYPEHADALVAAYLDFNLSRMNELIGEYPGMAELLSDLTASGVRIGIATSKRRRSAELTLDAVGLDQVIAVTAAMEDTEVHKPDPAPLLFALDRLGCRREESVYVGDAVVDVQAALAAGMTAMAVTWGAGLPDQLAAARPAAVATTLDELRGLLLA